jgi:hypothetical protein
LFSPQDGRGRNLSRDDIHSQRAASRPSSTLPKETAPRSAGAVRNLEVRRLYADGCSLWEISLKTGLSVGYVARVLGSAKRR